MPPTTPTPAPAKARTLPVAVGTVCLPGAPCSGQSTSRRRSPRTGWRSPKRWPRWASIAGPSPRSRVCPSHRRRRWRAPGAWASWAIWQARATRCGVLERAPLAAAEVARAAEIALDVLAGIEPQALERWLARGAELPAGEARDRVLILLAARESGAAAERRLDGARSLLSNPEHAWRWHRVRAQRAAAGGEASIALAHLGLALGESRTRSPAPKPEPCGASWRGSGPMPGRCRLRPRRPFATPPACSPPATAIVARAARATGWPSSACVAA
jgi:hypothetical protein